MLYKNREKFVGIGDAVGKKFSLLPVSANQWTALTFVAALAASYFIASSSFLYAAILFAIAASLDIVDGSVARFRQSSTPKGAFYDTIIDRYVEFIVILALFLAGLPGFIVSIQIWILLLLFGGMMTTYARAAAKRDIGVEVKGGIVERGERLIILFIGIVAAVFSTVYLSYAIVLLSVLSNISALQRIVSAVMTR